MKLHWSNRATNDLATIADFISKDSPGRARKYVQRLIDCAKQAARFPHSGRVVPEFRDAKLREIIVDNYRIVYQINDKNRLVTVLTVFEAHMLLK